MNDVVTMKIRHGFQELLRDALGFDLSVGSFFDDAILGSRSLVGLTLRVASWWIRRGGRVCGDDDTYEQLAAERHFHHDHDTRVRLENIQKRNNVGMMEFFQNYVVEDDE